MGPLWTTLAPWTQSTPYTGSAPVFTAATDTHASPGFPPKGAVFPTPDIPREESAPIPMLLDVMAVSCGREHIWPLLLSFYAGVMKMTFTYSLYRAVEEIDQEA